MLSVSFSPKTGGIALDNYQLRRTNDGKDNQRKRISSAVHVAEIYYARSGGFYASDRSGIGVKVVVRDLKLFVKNKPCLTFKRIKTRFFVV